MRYVPLKSARARLLLAALTSFALAGAFTSSSGAAQAHKAAAKPATWVIGNIGTYSGINDSNFVGGGQTLQAWALWVNAHGGLNGGHHVRIISYDDAGNATTSENDVKKLVADHVIAIVAMNSGEDSTWDTYIQSTGVPVIGGSTPLPDFASNPDYFPVGATANNSVPDLLLYAKNVLNQTVGGYLGCEEAPVCAALEAVYAGAYKGIGGNLAYNTLYSSSAPSYAAQCLAAQSAGVQDLEIIGPSFTVPKIAASCGSQGYEPTLLLNDVVLTPQLATQLGSLTGIFGADAFPFTATSGAPGVTAFRAALKKYEPGVLNASTFTQDDATTWASGQLFAAAAKAAKLGNHPTAAEVKTGLYKLHNDTLGGLAPPLTFNKGKPNSINCIYIIKVTGGSITEPQGLKTYCPAVG
jgi:branched-chain amino acid transport system substrate-binding protein